jgi:hypothetical protein
MRHRHMGAPTDSHHWRSRTPDHIAVIGFVAQPHFQPGGADNVPGRIEVGCI